jgi:hypothetical protein
MAHHITRHIRLRSRWSLRPYCFARLGGLLRKNYTATLARNIVYADTLCAIF